MGAVDCVNNHLIYVRLGPSYNYTADYLAKLGKVAHAKHIFAKVSEGSV